MADRLPGRVAHPEPCSMAWPANTCNCIGCVYREITQLLWSGLFSAWREWPRTAAR